MNYNNAYRDKLMTADDAAKTVKSGDYVMYSHFTLKTPLLDEALAFRKMELEDVKINFVTLTYMPEVIKADPEGEVFAIRDGSFSAMTRGLCKMGIPISAIPSLYHESGREYKIGNLKQDVLFLAVTPMNEEGYFNLGPESSYLVDLIQEKGGLDRNMKIFVEVNARIPYVFGDNRIHISEVDGVIEGEPENLLAIPKIPATEIDKKIAEHIMSEMVDGACLQLGIGGMPNCVGSMLVDSDFKDLGCHSEMFVDAYMELHQAGKLTNKRKNIDIGKSVFTFAMGSKKLYEFLDNNPEVECRSVSYTNNPFVIAKNDKVYSICSCIAVDMMGNVSSESVGYKQISATGGQWDYHYASMHSAGGKGFVCMPSTKKDRKGNVSSNIVTSLPEGTQISVACNTTNYVVTEFGAVNIKGLSMWERVEALSTIAHPDFREEILQAAAKAGIWRRSNKR